MVDLRLCVLFCFSATEELTDCVSDPVFLSCSPKDMAFVDSSVKYYSYLCNEGFDGRLSLGQNRVHPYIVGQNH